jgi:dGTPase
MRMPAVYACDPARGRGRRMAEVSAADRDDFQRDRDRIVHSSAFRRLVYKTQVFLNHEGDLFRTRLTHSLELAQLARSMARNLGLNEDLTEAIALAHDLGHTPFGHAGQTALNRCMAAHGGFEHNLQSLRVVDRLEHRYPGFVGLNLCFETREGILKHCSAVRAQQLEAEEPQGVASRFLRGGQPSLEAQLCNLADEIAYSAHDVDDGVRSGLLSVELIQTQPLLARMLAEAEAEGADPRLTPTSRVWLYTALRRLLRECAMDLVIHTLERLTEHAPIDVDAVRAGPPLVAFSPTMRAELTALKRFLFKHLYRTPAVEAQMTKAQRVVEDLFHHYLHEGLPEGAREAETPERAVADYLAGMTDRFALREHARITGQRWFDPD